MNALLWTLVVLAALNTLGAVLGALDTPTSRRMRLIDAMITFGIGVWAAALLAA